MAVNGNCASMPTLLQAGLMDADLLIAATSADEINLLCCTTAHALNPKLHTIARIRNPEYTDQIYEIRDTFGLSMSVNPEKRAAQEIERLLQYPGFLRRDIFARGRAEIVELRVDANSKLRNVSLMDMAGIVRCRTLVCAVLRNGSAMVPAGNFVFQEGDRVFVTAPTENLTILLKNLGIITRRVRRVMLCGGSRICFYLARLLKKSGIQVQIIESSQDRANSLCAQLPGVEVTCGDASNLELLTSEGLAKCDALVALTGLDELNDVLL
jgi:trk system potassium uptake protein TrkA